jgi:hypothetical protein
MSSMVQVAVRCNGRTPPPPDALTGIGRAPVGLSARRQRARQRAVPDSGRPPAAIHGRPGKRALSKSRTRLRPRSAQRPTRSSSFCG